MKVVREGRKQKGWAKQFTCTGSGNGLGGCGAKLLVEEADLYHTRRHDIDETVTFTTFRCPSCSVQTDVEVPRSVKVRHSENTPAASD